MRGVPVKCALWQGKNSLGMTEEPEISVNLWNAEMDFIDETVMVRSCRVLTILNGHPSSCILRI